MNAKKPSMDHSCPKVKRSVPPLRLHNFEGTEVEDTLSIIHTVLANGVLTSRSHEGSPTGRIVPLCPPHHETGQHTIISSHGSFSNLRPAPRAMKAWCFDLPAFENSLRPSRDHPVQPRTYLWAISPARFSLPHEIVSASLYMSLLSSFAVAFEIVNAYHRNPSRVEAHRYPITFIARYSTSPTLRRSRSGTPELHFPSRSTWVLLKQPPV
jgi:hypothetical protein